MEPRDECFTTCAQTQTNPSYCLFQSRYDSIQNKGLHEVICWGLCSRRWPTMHPILPPNRPRIKCVARSRRNWVYYVLSWLLPETAHVVWPGAGTVLLILGRNAWFWNHFLWNHSTIGPINATMWNKAIQMSADLAGKPVEADLAADSASFWCTVTPVVGSIGSPFSYDRYNSKLDIFLPLIHSCCFNHIHRCVHL